VLRLRDRRRLARQAHAVAETCAFTPSFCSIRAMFRSELAEQVAEQAVVVEGDDDGLGRGLAGRSARAGLLTRRAPVRGRRGREARRTASSAGGGDVDGGDAPEKRVGRHDVDALQERRAPDELPAAVRAFRTRRRAAADQAAAKARAPASSASEAVQALSLDRRGTCSAAVAAGVPGGEY
jgi:hypothetical protein